jgi:sec-independent protein translocase protein TatA
MTQLPLILALGFGPMEIALLAGLGLLLFGKRLPDVARGMGRSVVEFKKGLSGLEEEVSNAGKPKSESTKSDSSQTPST